MKYVISCVISARASYARFREALLELNTKPNIELVINLAASAASPKYGKLSQTILNDGLTVGQDIACLIESRHNSMSDDTGLAILRIGAVYDQLKPDLVISIADRYETLATSIVASYKRIPLLHIQGGELTGNIDERVRHANSKLADYHIVSNEKSASRLIKMGEHPDSIFITGCPSLDICRKLQMLKLDDFSSAINKTYSGDSFNGAEPYVLVQVHPETETIEQTSQRIEGLLEVLFQQNTNLVLMWPNSDSGAENISKFYNRLREQNHANRITFINNLPPELFLQLMKLSDYLIGNSSVGIREASFLGIPVINIGDRQFGRDRGNNVIDCAWDKNEIQAAIKKLHDRKSDLATSTNLYGDGHASRKIASCIDSIVHNLPVQVVKRYYEH